MPAALVVLHAPAGYGKTVALTRWAADAERDGVWLRVREGMGEPLAFAQQLSVALADAGLLDESNPLRTAAESLTALREPWDLLSRGLRRIPHPVTLVLDEAEHLDETTIDGLLRLLTDLPTLSLRVATRRANRFTEPGLSLALDVRRIDTAELALTADEAATLLGPTTSDAAVDHVLDNGASPALARVLLLAGETASDPSRGGAEDALETAVESLLRLRAPAWDDQFRGFFRELSLSDAVDVDLATALTGAADAAALLDRAEAEGLGYWAAPPSPDRSDTLFVLSPVFRRTAERSARRTLPAERVRAADTRVARWHLAAGRALPALQAALRARDGDLVTDVVREHWYDLIRSAAEVRASLGRVPALTLRNRPLQSMLLAILWNAQGAHRLRALEYFAIAAYGARAERARARPADRALLAMVESTALRVSGRTAQAGRIAEACYRDMCEMSEGERMRLGRNESTIFNHIGLSLFVAGRVEEALDCFRRSDAVGRERGLLAGRQGLAHLAGVHALAGDMPEAAGAVARGAEMSWPDGWEDGYAGSLLQVARAQLAIEDGDPDAASAALATLERHRTTIEHWAIIEQIDAVAALLRGDVEAGILRLERAEREQGRRQAQSPASAERVRRARALLELGRGDLEAARGWAMRLSAGAAREIMRARVSLAAGDADGALRALSVAPLDTADTRTLAEHLALTAAAVASAPAGRPAAAPAAPAAEGPAEVSDVAAALVRLHAVLVDRGLFEPLVLVPAAGLEALRDVAVAEGLSPDLVAVLERAMAAGVIGARATASPRLTRREVAVARELGASETVAEIAAALSVSPNTVKSQLRSIYRKLGVGSRDEALRALAARGLVGEDPSTDGAGV